MSPNPRSTNRTASRVLVQKTDIAARRRRIILILSAASALALCSLGLARADTYVTVNADGSITRTEVEPAQNDVQRVDDDGYDRHEGSTRRRNRERNRNRNYAGNTTIFSGSYVPLPQVYYGYPQPQYAPAPQGYTYPIGPVSPHIIPPTITVGPSSPPVYVLPGYGYYVPQQPYYPYPVYTYPQYGVNGTYYSGPAGGGGTIYSSTTTQNNGVGLVFGDDGFNISIGNGNRTTTSTTTVTTTGPQY